MIYCLGEHRLNLILLADVRLDGDGLASELLYLMRHVLGSGRIGHVVDHDIGVGLCQTKCDSLADTGGAAFVS